MNRGWGSVVGLGIAIVACLGLLRMGASQEVALGSLRGHVVMAENGKPLPKAEVTLMPTVLNADSPLRTVTTKTDEKGEFTSGLIPVGQYEVSVSGKAHSLPVFFVMLQQGAGPDRIFKAVPKGPHMEMYVSQHNFTPSESGGCQIEGFVPDANIATVKLFALDRDRLMNSGSLRNALSPVSSNDLSAFGKPFKVIEHKLATRDVEGVFAESLEFGVLPAGIYALQVSCGGFHSGSYLNVTNLAIVTKSARDKGLVFATDITTGDPVAGAEVYGVAVEQTKPSRQNDGDDGNSAKSIRKLGVTNSNGLLALPAGTGMIVAFHGGSMASANWQSRSRAREAVGALYTERPAYQPGDTIQFKGIIRRIVGPNQYAIPGAKTVSVEFDDSDGNQIAAEDLAVSAHGSFSGEFASNKELKPGSYSITAKWNGGKVDRTVPLLAYRKPEFTVTVKPEQPQYHVGDVIKMDVNCQYYYGSPVPGAEVSAAVMTSLGGGFNAGDESTVASDEDGGGFPGSGLGLDMNGAYGSSDQPGWSDTEASDSYKGDIQATTDNDGHAILQYAATRTGTGDDPLTEYTGPITYAMNATVSTPSGRSVEGDSQVTVIQSDVSLEIGSNVYSTAVGSSAPFKVLAKDLKGKPIANLPVRLLLGYEPDSSEGSPKIANEVDLTTGADGCASAPVKFGQGGSAIVAVAARDASGRLAAARAYLWISGGASPLGQEGQKTPLAVRTDKGHYAVGDTATVFINAGHPGGSALVCMEGRSLYKSDVVPLTSSTVMYKLKITDEYLPNAAISVCVVRHKEYREANAAIRVKLGRHELGISVKPDKTVVRPGDTVSYRIHTSVLGKPVPAEVSLAVIDEALYAIREDSTDLVSDFYPYVSDNVSTDYSFQEIYLDGGDKGGANVAVRKKFSDSAFWAPTVETGKDGNASVTVHLPDNLTSWRATVVGVTDTTEVGKAKVNILARKDLTVRIEAPSTVVALDDQQVTVTVRNDTPQDQDVHVSLVAENAKLQTDEPSSIHLEHGTQKAMIWMMSTENSGSAKLTAKAWVDHGANDGVEQKIEVRSHARLVVQGHTSQIAGGFKWTFQRAKSADPKVGGLVVKLTPSLASSIRHAWDSLSAYPYWCTEQTTSRLVPTALLAKYGAKLGLPFGENSQALTQTIDDCTARLRALQRSDGDWGWWEYDQAADPGMTGYALRGLKRVSDCGQTLRFVQIKQALEASENLLHNLPANTAYVDGLMLADGISCWNPKSAAVKSYMGSHSRDLVNAGPAEWAQAALVLSRMGDNVAAKTCVRWMVVKMTTDGELSYWQGRGFPSSQMVTANCLRTLLALEPHSPAIASAVRYLMANQTCDMWDSTWTTAIVIEDLVDYLLSQGPGFANSSLSAPHQVTVTLNGKVVASPVVDPSKPGDAMETVRIPMSAIRQGANDLRIEGVAACYCSAQFSEYRQSSKPLPAEPTPGLQIQRQYMLAKPIKLASGDMGESLTPVDPQSLKQGDIVVCKLTITAKERLNFVQIDEPFPSNFSVLERTSVDEDEGWDYMYDDVAIFHDRVEFFVRELDQGVEELTYHLRVEGKGTTHALPTAIGCMYNPASFSSGAETAVQTR